MRMRVMFTVITAALLLLASCATGRAPENKGPVVEVRQFTDRQNAVAVSLAEEQAVPQVPAEPVPEVVNTPEEPEPEPEQEAAEIFSEAVPVSLEVRIIEEPVETPVEEDGQKAPEQVSESVRQVNLAGEDGLIPQSLLVKEEAPVYAAEPVTIVPEEKQPEPAVDEIRPEDLVPYDVTVSDPEPWYRNVLSFLSAYGVWVAILFAIFAVVVILIVLVIRRPSSGPGREEEEPRVFDEGPMEDETAAQEASFDPEVERIRSVERIGESSEDEYDPTEEFTGDEE